MLEAKKVDIRVAVCIQINKILGWSSSRSQLASGDGELKLEVTCYNFFCFFGSGPGVVASNNNLKTVKIMRIVEGS